MVFVLMSFLDQLGGRKTQGKERSGLQALCIPVLYQCLADAKKGKRSLLK
jgi:hypothetical protein